MKGHPQVRVNRIHIHLDKTVLLLKAPNRHKPSNRLRKMIDNWCLCKAVEPSQLSCSCKVSCLQSSIKHQGHPELCEGRRKLIAKKLGMIEMKLYRNFLQRQK